MTMEPLILIGQAPGRYPHHDPDRHALFPYPSGCTGSRLKELMGLSRGRYLAIKRRNLLPYYPGGSVTGDNFPIAEARRRAEDMEPELQGRCVVFVGYAVARAFGYEEFVPLVWYHHGRGYRWCVVPHPSGRNRWWNNPDNRAMGERFLSNLGREYLDAS